MWHLIDVLQVKIWENSSCKCAEGAITRGDRLRRGGNGRAGPDHRLPAGDVATPITRSPSRHPPHIQFLSLPSKNFTTARRGNRTPHRDTQKRCYKYFRRNVRTFSVGFTHDRWSQKHKTYSDYA